MRDAIHQLVETEAEATRLVAAAKAEAERIVAAARKEAEELAAHVHQQTRVEVETLVQAATREAEQEKQERLARVAAEIQARVGLDEATRQRAIEGAVTCVCGFR